MTLSEEIKKIISGDVLEDSQSLEKYSTDASIFKIRPKLIVFPKTSQDVEKLVEFVSSRKDLSIIPRSAGTDMSGGAIGEGIILDMTKYFNKIVSINDNSSVVEPGVYYKDFEVETLKKDLILPSYTASKDINTVGGMVANNSAGEKTLSFGQTQDYVEGLKVILSDGNEYEIGPLDRSELNRKMAEKSFEGEIYRKIYELIEGNFDEIQKAKPKVTKNATGYLLWEVWDREKFDLSKLFVGFQGTLGIITQIKFKLIKPKPFSSLLVIFLKNLDNLGEIINTLLSLKPESLESYDDKTMKVALKFLPEMLKPTEAKNTFFLFFKFLPEMWMSVTGGMPKLIILSEFTGDSEKEVAQKAEEARSALSNFKVKTRIVKGGEEKKYWALRRESFNLLRHHSEHMRTAPFIDDIIVPHECLPQFLPKLEAVLDEYNKEIIYTVAGHVGNGNFHIIPLMDFHNPNTKNTISELSKRVFSLVLEYKGSISAEHNDGLVRGPYLEQMYGEKIYNLFKEVKTIFDPKNIFNPHKKVNATFEYSFEHLSPI